ncbi:damage-inducible protein [Candidatus Poribacteria bacterium]|nr:MAG: damage-inducible protein [Candidatus Poribacteria bacterium]
MSETTEQYFGLEPETDNGFQSALNHIRETSDSEYGKGKRFERMMKVFFSEDPIYQDRFSNVWLWDEWAADQQGFNLRDLGIDLVAKESDGGYCAIQCKCYADNTVISKGDIDSFISASNRDPFTSRIIVDTGADWGPNALKTIDNLNPECQRIHYTDLARSQFQWPDLSRQRPEELKRKEPYKMRPHQQEAFDDVIKGFEDSDSGKMIMACGTGKTFTALKIAEEIAGVGKSVLYLVPSISLLSQTMREWAEQKSIPHRYIGICSDRHVGRTDEDIYMQELEIPVTTNLRDIMGALQNTSNDKMTVVFCTYQSLPKIKDAQNPPQLRDPGLLYKINTPEKWKAPQFDLVICDEAHRTTGVEKPGDKTSPFILVHNKERIRGQKRLYMTATAKLYTEGIKAKAAREARGLFSMDDENIYGPEFHRLNFYKAVQQNLLSDFKVVILAVSEDYATPNRTNESRAIPISRSTQIFGCWQALQNPEKWSRLQHSEDTESPIQDTFSKQLTRAIAFTRTISTSKEITNNWNNIIEDSLLRLPEDQETFRDFRCEIKHVDGKTHAFKRKKQIEWLRGDNKNDDVCRILSNAKCLSEGIDVPALDAVLFIDEKKSVIEIVQAVGRVMRKTKDKEYGYVVLPIAIPERADISEILDADCFSIAWSVLRALRSHDERFNAEINRIDMNTKLSDRIIIAPIGFDGDREDFQLPLFDQATLLNVIYPKIVEKCGDRQYWETWAKDVALIFKTIVYSIEKILDNPDTQNDIMREWFDSFHTSLKKVTNDSVTRDNAIEMVAQHIITHPVFNALFENYEFSENNPIAKTLNELVTDFSQFGFKEETRGLKDFYESVRQRASGIDNPKGKQKVLMELYQKFFIIALKKESQKLGIAYTPVEIIDFMLHSVDEILQNEFNCCLSDEGVNILDPFIGTGTSLVRLLESDLIRPEDLERKYSKELYACEILSLAYYIAAVNIEEAFRMKCKEHNDYQPFDGIILADTFNLNKKNPPSLFEELFLKRNNERVEHQQKVSMKVIISNPPWSIGQKSATDNNPNVKYPDLEKRIKLTYAARSKARAKNSLYDTYKKAIRWASDRIEKEGIIAFVTPGSWVDGNADAGVRACLAEEFNSVYVLHLRGDAYTSGERRRAEGENVFGNSTRTPVAITILVKNSNATQDGCHINYLDIGDYLKSEEKLDKLRKAISIKGFTDWQTITPNKHDEWINQRNEAFEKLYPLGSEDAKKGKTDDTVFRLYSQGLATGRDAYSYNFSRDACAKNARGMTQTYLAALSEFEAILEANPELTINKKTLEAEVIKVAYRHNSNLKWDRELRNKLRRKKKTNFSEEYIRKVVYRPFVATNCYVDHTFIYMKFQMDKIFPNGLNENRAICVPGTGSTNSFSVLMTDTMPDMGINAGSQCFPRYFYLNSTDISGTTNELQDVDKPLERIDNIPDSTLQTFRSYYDDDTITKDAIFDYVYGVMHAPVYQEQFANNLSKELPRIPFAPDFHAFTKAGAALATLHLNYETCEQYQALKIEPINQDLFWEERPEHFLLNERGMRFEDKTKKDILIINEYVLLSGIPEETHRYTINGRTPLEWFIDRYKIVQKSGITNDPNDWFDNPHDLVEAIKRIVYVSVESTKIIESLPSEISAD